MAHPRPSKRRTCLTTGTENPRPAPPRSPAPDPRSPYTLALALALTLALHSPSAHAQAKDPAAAEALFREGRALSDAGDIAGACPKFRESDRLDPAVGPTFN